MNSAERNLAGITRVLISSWLVVLVVPAVAARGQTPEPPRDPRPGDRSERGERFSRERRDPGGPQRTPEAGRGFWNRMSDSERAEIEGFMEEHFPQMFLEIQQLRNRNPQRFRNRIDRIVYDIRHMMDLMETQPERGALMIQERQLNFQMRKVASHYHSAKQAKARERVRKRFRELSAQAFDCRHRRREMEIRELEARIAELLQRHAEAEHMREKLIDREVEKHLSRRPGP